ncbi:transmembrane protein 179B [Sceloporus undulatus]|uniref:transmembrane protein 179B n=1 Tax=Sceloporus undulatus TaxID=8520 RepID=UPI001C4CC2F8|nr:transmembrane protein 179B [Sceloporus undulatus]
MAGSGLELVGLALHAASFLCGVICASALTVTQGEFGGRCILYGSVVNNGSLVLSATSPASLCNFVSTVSILTAILSFVALLRGIYRSCFGNGHPLDGVWVKGSLSVSAVVLFFLMVSACILRVGMDAFCTSIHQAVAAISCQEAQHQPWVSPYHSERFYDNLYTAEAAAWVNFFFWCLMSVMVFMEWFSKAPSGPLRGSGLSRTEETDPIFGAGPLRP